MIDPSLDYIVQLARQAGDLLIGYFRSHGLRTSLKADRSVVTDADLAADELISNSIRTCFPGERILSEEVNPALPELQTGTAPVWIIDPLDGTTNFSLGLPIWGILITRLSHGWPELGVVYFPVLNELYTASKNQGAFFNGELLRISPRGAWEKKTTFFSTCSRTFRRYVVDIPYKARIFGSAAYSFCCVAKSAALIGFEATPKIWDIAAVWLILKEAGCQVETFDHSQPFPIQLGLDYAKINYPTLAALSPELIAKARSHIKPK